MCKKSSNNFAQTANNVGQITEINIWGIGAFTNCAFKILKNIKKNLRGVKNKGKKLYI
jgi:hypothetical protein